MDEFCIGVELEGYWQGKAGFHLPGDDVSHEDFAEALVPVYNKIRGEDMLRAIFSEAPHAGHFENPKNQWAVTLDSGIGDELLDPKHRPKGRMYLKTLCGVPILIRLTTIQIRLNLSLQYCRLAGVVSGLAI